MQISVLSNTLMSEKLLYWMGNKKTNHAAAIFVRFPVYPIRLQGYLSMHEKGPDYIPIQPRFGNMDLYWRNTRCLSCIIKVYTVPLPCWLQLWVLDIRAQDTM